MLESPPSESHPSEREPSKREPSEREPSAPVQPEGRPNLAAAPAPRRLYHWPAAQLRRLYRWTIDWAHTRYALPALFILALVEASVFPIPPDVLLMALCLSRPRRAFVYAAVCTVGSVVGALLGYLIGYTLWRSLGVYPECPQYAGGALFFEYIPSFHCDAFARVRDLYRDYSEVGLFVAAVSPIPFKVFTIAAGVFHVGLVTLVLVSTVGRAARFFAVAGLLYRFGPAARAFIERRFEMLTLVFGGLLVLGFVALRLLL